jgi:hypothetical protein
LVRITLSSSTRYSHPRLLIEEDFTVWGTANGLGELFFGLARY